MTTPREPATLFAVWKTYLLSADETEVFKTIVVLSRHDDSHLKFTGERLGKAGKCEVRYDGDGNYYNLETSLLLYKTTGGKYVASVEEFDQTNKRYGLRDARFAETLNELVEFLQSRRSQFLKDGDICTAVVDDDLLVDLFKGTRLGYEIASQSASSKSSRANILADALRESLS